ncbi:MAG TPA: S53 family peptidase, partial [Urbifossiella sp.]|nr:S53 family peptidase [Urbifossiella sp.]
MTLFRTHSRFRRPTTRPADSRFRPALDVLECRAVPAANAVPGYMTAQSEGATPDGSPAPVGLTPAQIRGAYGFNAVTFGTVTGNGAGQTIAIVDAYDPHFVSSSSASFLSSDLHLFDTAFGLPDPAFTKVNQTGGTSYPAGNTGWGTEIALDVEWAHAAAPGANILLVEANSSGYADLFAAVNYAKSVAGVSVVSMSFGGGEFSGETSYDSTFTTPAGHAGVTFVAATGDGGAPGGYPAYSSRVLAVGGTTLKLTAAGDYGTETGWASGTGGDSPFEPIPAYQAGLLPKGATGRGVPDVAYSADNSNNRGFAVYDTVALNGQTGWFDAGGDSAGTPQWGALVAIANQLRATNGLPAL